MYIPFDEVEIDHCNNRQQSEHPSKQINESKLPNHQIPNAKAIHNERWEQMVQNSLKHNHTRRGDRTKVQ